MPCRCLSITEAMNPGKCHFKWKDLIILLSWNLQGFCCGNTMPGWKVLVSERLTERISGLVFTDKYNFFIIYICYLIFFFFYINMISPQTWLFLQNSVKQICFQPLPRGWHGIPAPNTGKRWHSSYSSSRSVYPVSSKHRDSLSLTCGPGDR